MSITLELSPELEASIERAARLRGTDSQAFLIEAGRIAAEQTEAERRALVASLKGRAKGPGPTVDEFLAERSAEGRRDAGL